MRDGGADGVGVAEIEGDAAAFGLVGARGGSLDDDGVAEGDGGFNRLVGRVRDRLADERDAVGEQEGTCLGRLEPGVVLFGECSVDDRGGGGAVDPASSGTEPSGRRSQSARSAARPSARAADSG